MESELHGVLNRRAQPVRDAKRDGGTGSEEEQEAKMAQSSWLEVCTPYTPHPMHECQNKEDTKWAIRKRMKTKRLFFARRRGAIHKCLKRKNDDFGGWRGASFRMGIVW